MMVLQATVLTLVLITGAATALTRDPLRQAFVAGIYGPLLVTLFLVLQAPDVALSAMVVGAVASPVMVLLALAKVRIASARDERFGERGSGPGGGR